MTWVYVGLAVNSFLFVFLKAFQQRNVAFNHYAWVIPISLGMAATEVYMVSTIAVTGMGLFPVLSIGLAAGLGSVFAMLVHNDIFKENSRLKSSYTDLATAIKQRVRSFLTRPTRSG